MGQTIAKNQPHTRPAKRYPIDFPVHKYTTANAWRGGRLRVHSRGGGGGGGGVRKTPTTKKKKQPKQKKKNNKKNKKTKKKKK
ncbi:MAG: hypothetical protein ACTHMJ_11005, partial [Thermomicrobiales bacterium]